MIEQLNETSEPGPVERSTGSVISVDPNRPKYNLAVTEYVVNYKPYAHLPLVTKHVLRRPTVAEEETRERMMPLLTHEAGKVDEETASRQEIQDGPANATLYNKILVKVFGYSKERDGNFPTDEVEALIDGEHKTVPIVEAIPEDHKSTVLNGLYPHIFDMHNAEAADGMEFFSLGAAREWVLRQEIGGREKLPDGTISPADFVILYTFREPSAADVRRFRNSAFAAVSWRDKDGLNHERRTVVLRVVAELFDKLLVSADGVEVKGVNGGQETEVFDARNKAHVALIPGAFKKGALLKLFTFVQGDLGNSQSA